MNLKTKVDMLEKLSGSDIDSWIEQWAELEREFHHKQSELRVLTHTIELKRELQGEIEAKANLQVAQKIAELEKHFAHDEHLQATNYVEKLDEVVDKVISLAREVGSKVTSRTEIIR